MDFLIVSSGFNCKQQVKNCYNSLLAQTYKNFKAVLISDGSTDGTNEELLKLKNKKVEVEIYDYNIGAAKRRYDAIHKHANSKETIIVLLGLDDKLLPNALEVIKKEYEQGKLMTYGNWVNQKGKGLPKDFHLEFDEETHKNRDYRKVTYRSTAPNTFKKLLFDNIPENEFKMNDGRYFDTTTESHLMFSCLEMCGKERIGIIYEPIYVYNQNLPQGTLNRLGRDYKYKVLKEVINRPKYNLI